MKASRVDLIASESKLALPTEKTRSIKAFQVFHNTFTEEWILLANIT